MNIDTLGFLKGTCIKEINRDAAGVEITFENGESLHIGLYPGTDCNITYVAKEHKSINKGWKLWEYDQEPFPKETLVGLAKHTMERIENSKD